MSNENFREEYPAHAGYSVEEIQDIAKADGGAELTPEQVDEVARRFNEADHSRLHDLLDSIIFDLRD